MRSAPPVLSSAGGVATVTFCPNAALAFGCLVALLYIFPLGGLGALAFLAAGMALVARRPIANLDANLRGWWILLLPAWCLVSTLWSAYPSLTLRFAVQFGLTTVIALAIAARVPSLTLVRTLFLALCLAALGSVLIGRARLDGEGYLGVYGSKNAFAQVMAVLLLAGLALGLGRDGSRGWRLMGLAALPAALGLLVMAQSAGWLLASVLTMACGIAFAAMRRVPPGARVFVVGMALLAILASGLAALAFQDQLAAAFLEATGKDVTLTGRTELWSIALSEIARQPYLGQGYQAVWVVGNPLAESLWSAFGISTRTGFHFHSTWLSNAVEIGVAGAAVQLMVFAAALLGALRDVLREARADTLFWAMFMVQMTIMSLLEVVAFTQFQISTMLILIAAARAVGRGQLMSSAAGPVAAIGATAPGSASDTRSPAIRTVSRFASSSAAPGPSR